MFKCEFPANNKPLAAAIGAALLAYGNSDTTLVSSPKMVRNDEGKAVRENVKQPTADNAGTQEAAAGAETASTATSAGTSTSAPAHGGETTASASTAPAGDVDEKGVAKNPDFCGTAAVPFYGSSKRKGQWKRKGGVEQSAYDEWYEEALADVEAAGSTPANDSEVDVGAAFGAAKKQDAGEAKTFEDAGQLMAWFAEMQAGGRLVSGDIENSYTATGTSLQDLFNPALADATIKTIYAHLAPIAAAA